MRQDLGQYVNACVREEEALWASSEHQTTLQTARELLYDMTIVWKREDLMMLEVIYSLCTIQ